MVQLNETFNVRWIANDKKQQVREYFNIIEQELALLRLGDDDDANLLEIWNSSLRSSLQQSDTFDWSRALNAGFSLVKSLFTRPENPEGARRTKLDKNQGPGGP